MHEFSIAEALADQVKRHVPEGAKVHRVEIVVGALRGIEPEALQMSWQAVTLDTVLEGSLLLIERRPWTLTCPDCGRVWESDTPFEDCACGGTVARPEGTDELNLIAITVDEGAD